MMMPPTKYNATCRPWINPCSGWLLYLSVLLYSSRNAVRMELHILIPATIIYMMSKRCNVRIRGSPELNAMETSIQNNMPGISSNMLYPSFLRTRTICQFDLCSLLFRNVTHLNRLCSPQFIAMHSPRRIRIVKTLSRIPANPSAIPNLPVIILFNHSTRVFIIFFFSPRQLPCK